MRKKGRAVKLTQGRRLKRGWMPLKVTKVIHENHDTRTLIMVNEEEGCRAFDYIAGQYLTFRFDELAPKPIVRSYTMSSSPCQEDYIAVTVKEVEDGFISKHLCNEVKEGDVLKARGPIGRFCYDEEKDHKNLTMVAAGSGVTPFISIMREYAPLLGKENAPEKMLLLVSFRSTNDLICWDDIESLRKYPNIEVVTTLSREDRRDSGFLYGRIDKDMLARVVGSQCQETTFMTCGPDVMMNMTVDYVLANGVQPEHMKKESFAS